MGLLELIKDAASTMNAVPIWQGRRRHYLAALVALGVAQALVMLGISALVAKIFASINAVDNVQHGAVIGLPVALMLIAAAVLALLRWSERVCGEHLGQDYVVQVRLRLFKHLMFADPRAAQRFSHGAMALRFVTDLNGLRQWVALGLARLIVVASTLIIVLAVLAFQQPALMPLVAGAVVLAIVLCVGIGAKLPQSIRAVRKYRARLAATVTDRINTVATVQACVQERREIRRVRRQSQSLYEAALWRANIVGALYGSLEATTVLASAAVLWIAGILVSDGQLTIADVAAGMTLLGLLLSPLRDLGRIFDYWQQWGIANEKIGEFLSLPERNLQPTKPALLQSVPSVEQMGHLKARGISIEGLLEASDFDIEAGQHIVLEGDNGVGKTSLLLTLAGVLPLQQGQLELDGHTLVGHRGARKPVAGIGLVSPDIGLMRGSLARNITYANPRVSEQEINDVVQRCDLEKLIDRLPNGLSTRISEGGKNLSVGERKRIMLARTLLMRPRLLLLDELDAHLDAHSLQIIEQALTNFQGTIIEVSHHRKLCTQKPIRYWRLQQSRIHELNNCAEQYYVNAN